MAAALNKIAATSPSRQSPSELETSIANALYDLESNIPDMKTALRPLQFVSAREVRPFFSFGNYVEKHFKELYLVLPLLSPSMPAGGFMQVFFSFQPGKPVHQRRIYNSLLTLLYLHQRESSYFKSILT